MKAAWWATLFGVFGLCLACVIGYLALVAHRENRPASPDYSATTAAAVVDPGPHEWWIADSGGRECITGESPGEKIKELRQSGSDASSTVNNTFGTTPVISVEVTVPVGDLRETVWTFFRQKADCEAAVAKENGSAPELQ